MLSLQLKNINVSGIIFNSELDWSDHIACATMKLNKELNTFKQINRFFYANEIIMLPTFFLFCTTTVQYGCLSQ
jgi:hypothetical protein